MGVGSELESSACETDTDTGAPNDKWIELRQAPSAEAARQLAESADFGETKFGIVEGFVLCAPRYPSHSRYQALLGNGLFLKLRFIFYERDSEEEAELSRRAFLSGAWERENTSARAKAHATASFVRQIVLSSFRD